MWISHSENNKTLLLISTIFPPSTTSADKLFCNWKGKNRTPISQSAKLTNKFTAIYKIRVMRQQRR